jgi:hypothetical protein
MKIYALAAVAVAAGVVAGAQNSSAQHLTYPGYSSGISPYSFSYNQLTAPRYYGGYGRGYNSSYYNNSYNGGYYGGGNNYSGAYTGYNNPYLRGDYPSKTENRRSRTERYDKRFAQKYNYSYDKDASQYSRYESNRNISPDNNYYQW